MLETALLGIISSIATEIVKGLNLRLAGRALEGQGALLLSVVFALAVGFTRLILVDVPFEYVWSIEGFLSLSAMAFGLSQLYFKTIAKWFGLTVSN